MTIPTSRIFTILIAAALLLAGQMAAQSGDDPWPDIHQGVFAGKPIADNSLGVKLFAPNEAQDAAIVPITLTLSASEVANARSLTLVIDRNPMPVAAKFTFAEGYRAGPATYDRTITTRVRVDAFSRIRAVLERADGSLAMTSKFVIGSGGCSAPAAKDQDQALAQLGRTQLKVSKDAARPNWREAQVMIRHPNFTGMQREKATGNFTPARYVDVIDVAEGGALLLRIEGGISISEDPNIRFSWESRVDEAVSFTGKDTEGARFTATAARDAS